LVGDETLKKRFRQLNLLLAAFVGLFGAIPAFAADVQMHIEPQLIGLMDRAVLKIEFIDTKGDAVQIPSVDGLKIQYQGQSSQVNIVNMRRTSKLVHSYLITPTRTGDFTIGPVVCKYRGGQKTLTARLRVIKPKDDPEAQAISQMLFSRISASRSAPYVHEPFDLQLKVYVKDGVRTDGSFGLRGGLPESGLDGDLDWEVVDQGREEVNGQIYQVYTLQTTVKTLTAGTFVFQPRVQLNLVIPHQRRRSYGFDDPFFGDFFGRQETRPVVLDCNKLEIPVQPIPMAGRPESFTGGVGVFNFEVKASPQKVKAGEPVTIQMKITGEGNLSQITPPKMPSNPDLKCYDARILKTPNPDELVFEQVVIPKSERVKQIPPIAFSYFNTKTSDFRTIKKGPFPIEVDAGAQKTAQVIARVESTLPTQTEILGRDIVYLKPQPETWYYRNSSVLDTKHWILYLFFGLPALLVFGAWFRSAHRNALAGDVARARRQKAPKAAKEQLQRAHVALRKKDAALFYEAAWNALADYLGHRLNLAPGEVSANKVAEKIPQQAEALTELFNTIEQRRYGASASEDSVAEMKQILKRIEQVLAKCERIKR
jgi:hypothetical protein